MPSNKKLLSEAKKPSEEAVKLHRFYRGKIEMIPKCAVRNFQDFAIWYTPGVAKPCEEISKKREMAYEYTNKWNTVAIVTDGSRVLGLGDIGPEAAMPVMEGKALLFKYLGGVDAVPICLNTKNPKEIITAVKWLQPSFGGINLEDISKPECFEILQHLREEMEIPVWHDDQQGTATVILAGLINALKLVNKKIKKVLISMIGAGAANIAIARLLIAAGAQPGNIIMADSKGILHSGRAELQREDGEKWNLCVKTNAKDRKGGIREAMEGTDVCIACSKPEPGTIKKEWVARMARDPIVFACANPLPEIWPWEAKEAGAKIIGTGRSDFPNQVNNSLGFPGIFRGVLDVKAKTITDEMCIAAAMELAKCAEEKGINENYIVPTMDEWEIFPKVAVAVGMKAIEQGVARENLTKEALYQKSSFIIKRARELTQKLMEEEFILPPPA